MWEKSKCNRTQKEKTNAEGKKIKKGNERKKEKQKERKNVVKIKRMLDEGKGRNGVTNR